MAYELRLQSCSPSLREVTLNLEELCIGIFEHLLSFVSPFLSCRHIAEREDVARLGSGNVPIYRIAVFLRTGIREGVYHLRNEDVLHGGIEIRVGIHDGVELMRGISKMLILNSKRTELMLLPVRGLPLICPVARSGVHLEVARAVYHVCRSANRCGWRIIIAVRLQERHYHSREGDREVCSVFIRVIVAALSVCLPFIGSVQVEVNHLTASESILLLESDHNFRTRPTVYLITIVGLHVCLVRLVEHAAHRHVERIAEGCRILRRESKLHGAVLSGVAEPVGTLHVCVIAELLLRQQAQMAQKQTSTDRRFPAVEGKSEAAVGECIPQLFHRLLHYVHLHLAYIPLVVGCRRYVIGKLQTQMHLTGNGKSVGKIRGV